jgi:hypothetical protein
MRSPSAKALGYLQETRAALRQLEFGVLTDIRNVPRRQLFEKIQEMFLEIIEGNPLGRVIGIFIEISQPHILVLPIRESRRCHCTDFTDSLSIGQLSNSVLKACRDADYRKPLTMHAQRSKISSIRNNPVNPVCFARRDPEAVKEINADCTCRSLAAREIARQFFEAEKVLRSLLESAGI